MSVILVFGLEKNLTCRSNLRYQKVEFQWFSPQGGKNSVCTFQRPPSICWFLELDSSDDGKHVMSQQHKYSFCLT